MAPEVKDYYRILQVDPRAEPEVIEGAYRGLVRKYRRDADGSPKAAERIQELDEAYEVLRDSVKRAEYDERRNKPEAEWPEPVAPTVGEEPVGPTSDDGAAVAPEAAAAASDRAASPPQVPVGAVLDRAQQAMARRVPSPITIGQVLLIALVVAALLTRLVRLGTPGDKMFDEVYFPTTAQEILHGDRAAWEFYYHENTHPPLSKLFMAGGMGILGENSWGWRFPGAVAGVGAIIFIYLLGKRLFRNEWVGLIAGFLMTFEGLAFTQARIATPDTYVVFFLLGSVYFLVSDRFALSGAFWGAAMACKWTALFGVFPIVFYLLYSFRQMERDKADRIAYLAPLGLLAFYLGTSILFGKWLLDGQSHLPSLSKWVFGPTLLLWMLFFAAAPLAIHFAYRSRWFGGRQANNGLAASLASIPLFFVVIPLLVYLSTYIPMLLNHHSLTDVWELNKAAYLFHSTLEATHPNQAPWDTWPILQRPVFFFLGEGNAKVYNLGNPVIFWFGLPALAFALWQGLRGVRAKLDAQTGALSVWGSISYREAALLFVVLTYLALWLPWAIQPRIMFLYHYLNALPFLMLALAYAVYRLWQERSSAVGALGLSVVVGLSFVLAKVILTRLDVGSAVAVIYAVAIGLAMLALAYGAQRTWQQPWGRIGAAAFLAVVALTFVYFYPHLAAVAVSTRLDESYYWFASWR